MVIVYSAALALGFLALLVIVMGGAFAENLDRQDRDPGVWVGRWGKLAVGAVSGFGIGGMAAEFSPLELSWPAALAIAVASGLVGVLWVGYSTGVGAGS